MTLKKLKTNTPKVANNVVLSKIRKRDGRLVKFNQDRITNAIHKAIVAVEGKDGKEAKKLSNQVVSILKRRYKGKNPGIEDIQDVIEEVLIKNSLVDVAKAFIIYRKQHEEIRDVRSLVNSDKIIEDYLGENDWRVKENSNMAYSLQGLNNHVSSTVTARYWLNKVYPQEINDAHKSGDLHIHDLQALSAYCCGWDLKDLLIKGFGGVPGKLYSKPPKHFVSALSQIVNFFFTLQGEAAGAQAFSNFDTYLAPFVYADKLNYDQVKQGVQSFVFNLNVPTRVGFQTPFTNITMDLQIPADMKDQSVIIGGEAKNFTYGETQAAMDMINQAFTEVMTEGDGAGRVFTFPIPTYNITKNFDWENPKWNKLWEMTAKYGIPYFSNFVNSDMDPADARSMCCRLRLDNRELRRRGGGLFGANPLTGSIGVVTINMPRIGYLSKTKEEFKARLGHLMDLAKQSLELKREILEGFTEGGLYPYSKVYLDGIKKRMGSYWRNHFNTIGLVGMNEALLNFMGKGIHESVGQEFASEIMDFMRDKMTEFQRETGNMYNLEATPAEGTTYRLARADKDKYPNIIAANEEAFKKGAKPYYSNSTQLPVGFTDDIFEALELQDNLQTKYTGGTVFHGFLGEAISDIEGAKALVKKIAQNFHLPYYTLTPTFSVCPQCGYLSGEHHQCPTCKSDSEVYSRVVGYLRPVQQWNEGKRTEFSDRKTYCV
ncbi:MAG: ribonucleoside triphosphate reductase [Patescibacteria group bacterium]